MVEKKIILCIDRDNDIGEKTGIKGPVIGEKENMKAANALVLADPSDTDANTIFAALKLKKEHPEWDIATITGHKKVGVVSDENISKQLNTVVDKTRAKKVIIVTDGVEDEFVLPIIQSKMEIMSIHRVIVEQNERLEGAYYMIKNFINNMVDDKRLAKVFLGLPAIALILVALFGAEGWRVVIGAIGAYLFVKGFKLERAVNKIADGFSSALEKSRISFFLYVIGIIFIFIASAFGYYNVASVGISNTFMAVLTFLYGSLYLYFAAGLIIWAGAVLFAYVQNKLTARLGTILALFFAIIIVARAAIQVIIQPEHGINPLISMIIVGFVALAVAGIVDHLTGRKKQSQFQEF